METYHKINALFKRYKDGPNKGKLIVGDWATPELGYLANNEWEYTEKVDGTNIRIGFNRHDGSPALGSMPEPEFAGRSDNAIIPDPLLRYLEDKFTTELFIDAGLPEDILLFGEGYGPKIQGGGKYRDDHSFVLFDCKIGDWWLKRDDVNDIANKLGIGSVPVIGTGTLHEAIQIVSSGYYLRNNCVWSGNGNLRRDFLCSKWGNFEAEGIVATPVVPLFDRKGDRIITKIKAVDFR